MSHRSLKTNLAAPRLSQKLYSAHTVKTGERASAAQQGVEMFELMREAGAAVYQWVRDNTQVNEKILILVGTGNNGGDGYIAAALLKNQGYSVVVASIAPQKDLQGDAKIARDNWLKTGETIEQALEQKLEDVDLIVDALLGTGLEGEVRGDFKTLILAVIDADKPVLSVDIPSGIHADTGATLGVAIQAVATVTFVAIKPGLVTGNGKKHAGELTFAPLCIAESFESMHTECARLVSYADFSPLAHRSLDSHKGNNGKLLCIGGNKGLSGAIRLTAEAALRCGAGLVKVYCHQNSVSTVVQGRPEIMATEQNLYQMLHWADCIVLGPGLGQDSWSQETFNQVLSFLVHENKPVVFDADALNLLSQHQYKIKLNNLVVTPHAGEAARLINMTILKVEANRYECAQTISEHYSASCVLKGAGTVIHNQEGVYICADGNPGMSTAGMGDVLSGVLGAMMSQGMTANQASVYATCLHSKAADEIAREYGQRGIIASDLFSALRKLVN